MSGILVITPRSGGAVSLDLAKLHLREESNDQDALISLLIETVTASLDGPDGWLGRALLPQTLEIQFGSPEQQFGSHRYPVGGWFWHGFWGEHAEITLPLPPTTSVTSVKYIDSDGVEQTVDSATYALESRGTKSVIVPNYGVFWPFSRWQRDAWRVRFVTGYADSDHIPAPIKHAILMMVGHLYQNRAAVTDGRVNQPFEMPMGVEALLAPYRVYT